MTVLTKPLLILSQSHHYMKPALKIFCISLFAILRFLVNTAVAQPSHNGTAHRVNNYCGVTAVISPGNDSTITTNTVVLFTSASQNATSYQFFIDRIAQLPNAPLSYTLPVGLTEIKLVAYNGTCTDTAVCYYFFPGTFPINQANTKAYYGLPSINQYVTTFSSLSAGGYIIGGNRDNNSYLGLPRRGIIMKTTETGCIQWSRIIESSYLSGVDVIRETQGGGYYVAANVDYEYPFIMKLDIAGNIIWSKRIMSTLGEKLSHTNIRDLSDGGLLIVGVMSYQLVIIRLDNAGNIIWQDRYTNGLQNVSGVSSILEKDNAIYVGGYMDANATSFSIIMKLDKSTGQTIWAKNYTISVAELHNADSLITFTTFLNAQAGTYGIGGLVKIDTAGTIKSSAMIQQTDEFYPTGIRLVPLPDKGYYMLSAGYKPLPLQPGISYQTKLVRLDSAYNILWGRHYAAVDLGRFFYPALGPNKTLVIAGNEGGQGYSYYGSISDKIMVKKMDSLGSILGTSCDFYNWPMTKTPGNPVLPQPFTWITDVAATNIIQDYPVTLNAIYPEVRYKCPDYIDSCSYLKVTGPASVCNLNNQYTYTIHKNKACGQPTQWHIPPGIAVIQQTDSSLTVKFNSFGSCVISATLDFSCSPLKDSVSITAVSLSPPLNLGLDTSICPGNTYLLHAGNAFQSYLWPDGSTDSLFTVITPGQYWVQVTDICGNILRDTVTISAAPPVPLNIGPDRTKCNNDTLHLNAPNGFLNYSWSPNYQINSVNSQNVTVNPLVDTSYILKAEKTAGCFAFDTVHISAFHSQPINLGPDQSFCIGDSAILNAGNGFSQYIWSNSQSSQQIVVKTAGTYTVIAITAQGCRSYDTLRIVNVFSLPVVDLGQDSTLCYGMTRTLNAGNGYVSYAWNTGASTQTINVNTTGSYAVKITDNNNCSSVDTAFITKILPLPSAFLPADTAICSYGTIDLKSLQNFNQYLWSSGANTSTITISKPGLYWLQVKDNNNCPGKDSIIVNPKDCLQGFFIPNAFTPDNDGKNDLFKPLIFGDIKQYRFVVYDRWGQVVFQSQRPGDGWNGKYHGMDRDSNVFTWTCQYQLAGQPLKIEKGTVLLVR